MSRFLATISNVKVVVERMVNFSRNPGSNKLVFNVLSKNGKVDKIEWHEGMDDWVARNMIVVGPLLDVVQYIRDKPRLWFDWDGPAEGCYIHFRGLHLYPELIDDIAAVHRKLGPVLQFHGPPYRIPILKYRNSDTEEAKTPNRRGP